MVWRVGCELKKVQKDIGLKIALADIQIFLFNILLYQPAFCFY